MLNKLHFKGADFCVSADELSEELREALLDCGGAGAADEAVAYVRSNFEITGNKKDYRKMLNGYGAWEPSELADHDENLNRLVWLAGCELREQGEIYFSGY